MSVKTFFQASAPVTLKQNDPQLQRILNDPEYQRLWREHNDIMAKVNPGGPEQQALWKRIQAGDQSAIEEVRQTNQMIVAHHNQVNARFDALGGLPDNHYIVRDGEGNPRILRKTTTAGKIGRMGRQMALMAGAAFGGSALVGALAPTAGALPAAAPVVGGGGGAAAGGAGGVAGGVGGSTAASGAMSGVSFAPGAAASGGFGAGSAGGFTAGAAGSSAVGAGTGAGISMGPAFTGTALVGSAPAYVAPAASTAGWSNLLAKNSGELTKAGMSLAGSYLSGERGQRVATTALLKKRLEEYNRTQPGRQAMEASFMRRLPTHMQGNFPQNFLNTQPAPYVNANYPQFPGYPY